MITTVMTLNIPAEVGDGTANYSNDSCMTVNFLLYIIHYFVPKLIFVLGEFEGCVCTVHEIIQVSVLSRLPHNTHTFQNTT